MSDETTEILRLHAEKTEQGDRPTRESIDALRADGAFALRTPRAYGGAWAGTEAIALRLSELGRACPSSAWIAGTCVTSKNLTTRCLPDEALRACFADPDALFCGSGVPRARGERTADGVRIDGRWSYVSGCEDATWAGLGLMVDGRFSYAVVPTADLVVERTWHMAGMRGTGSHTLVASGVVVPDAHVRAAEPFGGRDLLLYGTTVLAPVVGATWGALDLTEAMFASDRKPFMTGYARMGDSPGARHWLAEAAHLARRARRTMLAVARAADDEDLPEAEIPRLRMELADAGRDCRAAVERVMDLHGTGGFATANPLQRFWRDVSVGSRHPHLNPYLGIENYGTALAG